MPSPTTDQPSPTTDQPSIPPPPSFADFKFSVIGQPPQLLKRMGATPPLDFRNSPTPMHMDLQYPSRAGTPQTSAATSQPSLQQRLESARYHTDSISDGHSHPMDVSEHLTEQRPFINSEQPITSPIQRFDGFAPSLSTQKSLHSSVKSYESRATPKASFSNTHAAIVIRRPSLSTILPSTDLAPGPSSSINSSETQQSLKPQLLLDMKLLYESALIAFEKAERGLKSAQETYDAAKASVTAIATRFPQALATDACQQHTSRTAASRSAISSNLEDPADPVIAEVSGDMIQPQKGPVPQLRPFQQSDYPTLKSGHYGRRIIELEQEADDVRLAWSSLSAKRCSITSLTRGADEYPPSVTPTHMRSSPGTSAGSTPVNQSISAVAADQTVIVKDEDITDGHGRPDVLGREHNLLSGISHRNDSASSHISIDNEMGGRTPLIPVSEPSRLLEDVKPIEATTFAIGMQDATTIADSSGWHDKGAKAPRSALRGSLDNVVVLDDTTEDDNSVDSDHTRSESNPISLGEDISNELEVVRELERKDSGPCSPSTSQDISRSSSIHPTERLDDAIDEEVPQTTPLKPSSGSREEQDNDWNSSMPQGLTAESNRSSALPSPQGDHRSLNENPLLQRLQPLVPTLHSSKILKTQPESVTGPPPSPPSILGKRQHFDPTSPRSHPSVLLPSKRRHFTNAERNDPPSLESRISEAFAPTNEIEQSNSATSPIHYRGEHSSYNKNSYASRDKYMPSGERSMSPPSGPRARRQESFYSKYAPAVPRRPLSNRSPVDRQLGVGSDFYPNKNKNKGLRKKFVHDGPIPTSGYDRPLGAGRGVVRQNRGPQVDWDSGSMTDYTGPRKTDMRTRPSERRGHEQMSLADRIRDP